MIVTRIGIVGCAGRMGRALIAAALRHPQAACAGGTERPGGPYDGKTLAEISGVASDLLFMTPHPDVASLCETGDVDALIDFSSPENALRTAEEAAKRGIPLVVGVTGLSPEQASRLKSHSGRIPLLHAANMSRGVNLLVYLTRLVAAVTGEEFDIEITEMHHKHKADAPSGTALALGRAAAEGRKIALEERAVYARHGQTGARRSGDIGFATLRGGAVVGDHEVLFAGENEHIALSHSAKSRDVFAEGAVFAAVRLRDKGPGFYTMADLLETDKILAEMGKRG
jgi:4-hydroxy-tetrahydrodipicolinate reductase